MLTRMLQFYNVTPTDVYLHVIDTVRSHVNADELQIVPGEAEYTFDVRPH